MINYCQSILYSFLLIYVAVSMCAYHLKHIRSQGKKSLDLYISFSIMVVISSWWNYAGFFCTYLFFLIQ